MNRIYFTLKHLEAYSNAVKVLAYSTTTNLKIAFKVKYIFIFEIRFMIYYLNLFFIIYYLTIICK